MKNRGVTLLALAITIVVLLILAGITLSITIGGNGLTEKTKKTGQDFDLAQLKDEVAVAYTSYSTRLKSKSNLTLGYFLEEIPNAQIAAMDENSWMVTKGQSKVIVDSDGYIVDVDILTLTEAKESSMLEKTDNTKVLVPYKTSNIIITIPAGYMVATDSGSTVDDGIVITDSGTNGNEWVWVPVVLERNLNNTYLGVIYNEPATAVTINGIEKATSSINGVTASKYTILRSRGLPNTTSYREPDVIVGTGTQYDTKQANYTTAGFESLNDMASTLVLEYNQMINSMEEYGGFYIGRYELSKNGSQYEVKRNKIPENRSGWYSLYSGCEALSANESKAISRMIWGAQWDLACKFIEDGTNGKNINNSSDWGNYKDVAVKASDGTTVIKEVGSSGQINTGVTTYTKAKNIYDIAGNLPEFTQEANSNSYRCIRGGSFGDNAEGHAAWYRWVGGVESASNNFGTRPVLIILPSNN